jgi:hypothetical protein
MVWLVATEIVVKYFEHLREGQKRKTRRTGRTWVTSKKNLESRPGRGFGAYGPTPGQERRVPAENMAKACTGGTPKPTKPGSSQG